MYTYKHNQSTLQSMIKLLISGFFLLMTSMTNAAIVQPTELTDSTFQLSNQKKDKTPPATDPQSINSLDTTTVQPSELPDKSTQLLEQKKNPTPSALPQLETSQNAEGNLSQNIAPGASIKKEDTYQSSIYSTLKSFAKMLLNEYGDNELVQEALSTLYEIKQLWDDADSLVNDFVYDVFFALKLEDFLENELAHTQQSLQISDVYILSQKDFKLSNKAHKIKGISLYQFQKAQTGTGRRNSQKLESTFFSKLFQVKSLYYLLALIICLSILQAIINFISRLFP